MKMNSLLKALTGLFLLIAALGLNTQAQKGKQKELPPDFDKYVNKVLQTFEVPGLAIAVVKDGKVLLSKGYGIRELGTADAVDEHTLFPIASNSKAFTGTALALLVEEGKLEWDAPVIQYLPGFRLADPYVTKEISIRDLLVHRSGIAPYAGDLMQFPPTTFSREEIVHKLRFLPLTSSFRSTYAYDNVLYLVAAEVIKAVSGQEWEDFIRDRIFKKVGMNESISKFSEFHSASNKATSHAHVNGVLKKLDHFKEQGLGDVSNPAGGICSNVTDMAKWLITQLDSGKVQSGAKLFSPATTVELWSGVTPMPAYKVNPWIAPAETDMNSYALGFRIYNYRGEKMVTHGGKLDGFVSFVNMIPSLNAGIVVLTNQESSHAYRAIINHLVDYLIGKEPYDWIAGYRKEEDRRFQNIARVESQVASRKQLGSLPPLSLDNFTGNFFDAWYGDISVKKEGSKLIMRFEHSPLLVGDMEYYQYNTFIVKWRHRDLKADAYVTYNLDENGKITNIKMKAVSPATDVSYDFHDLNILPKAKK